MRGDIEIPGPWRHRYVAANGARFHVAECSPSPGPARSDEPGTLVLFLHGFPEFWWAWRAQLPDVARAGYRTAAVDLRGYGGSDKTPRGYDPMTLAADVAGVINGLGERRAVLVGHGWGGYIAWAVAAGHPDRVSALCAVSAPHPGVLLSAPWRHLPREPVTHVLTMQTPWLPERRIAKHGYVARHLARWSSPSSTFPSTEETARYRQALALWPSPHCALEFHRWVFRSRLRGDGRAFAKMMRAPIDVPVLHIAGRDDPTLRRSAIAASARHVRKAYRTRELADVGHFPPEEAPEAFTETLLGWLGSIRASHGTRAGRDLLG